MGVASPDVNGLEAAGGVAKGNPGFTAATLILIEAGQDCIRPNSTNLE